MKNPIPFESMYNLSFIIAERTKNSNSPDQISITMLNGGNTVGSPLIAKYVTGTVEPWIRINPIQPQISPN